jgi:hypothetical protein
LDTCGTSTKIFSFTFISSGNIFIEMGCTTSTLKLKKEAIVLDESIHGDSNHGDLNVIDSGEIVLNEKPVDVTNKPAAAIVVIDSNVTTKDNAIVNGHDDSAATASISYVTDTAVAATS